MKRASQAVDADGSVAAADRELAFEPSADQQVWRHRMGFGAGDEHIDVVSALSRSPVHRKTDIAQIKAIASVSE